MGLHDHLLKMTKLDEIKNTFDFLINDYSFHLTQSETKKNFMADNFLVYRNDISKVQVEICADEGWFHSEVRRIINGEPAKYKDKANCISLGDLAIFDNSKYDHFDYSVNGSRLKGVLENTASLFKRHPHLFTTDEWIDTEKIEKLRDENYKNQHGEIRDKSKPTYFGTVKASATPLLVAKGYKLIMDSDELPPFDRDSMTKRLVFQTVESQINIFRGDLLDDYMTYRITKDHKKMLEIDISKVDHEKAVEMTMKTLISNA